GIPGNAVGKITLHDRKTFVRLPKLLGEPLVGARLWLRGHDIPVLLARPEPPPRKPPPRR
ncbi:MAG TPA: hypothetical protein PKA64_02455, partial [Myxococcota bacterium]|nr:hypothetical protein [Myxococcota bacterium]